MHSAAPFSQISWLSLHSQHNTLKHAYMRPILRGSTFNSNEQLMFPVFFILSSHYSRPLSCMARPSLLYSQKITQTGGTRPAVRSRGSLKAMCSTRTIATRAMSSQIIARDLHSRYSMCAIACSPLPSTFGARQLQNHHVSTYVVQR